LSPACHLCTVDTCSTAVCHKNNFSNIQVRILNRYSTINSFFFLLSRNRENCVNKDQIEFTTGEHANYYEDMITNKIKRNIKNLKLRTKPLLTVVPRVRMTHKRGDGMLCKIMSPLDSFSCSFEDSIKSQLFFF
jgi:hypothetical protein